VTQPAAEGWLAHAEQCLEEGQHQFLTSSPTEPWAAGPGTSRFQIMLFLIEFAFLDKLAEALAARLQTVFLLVKPTLVDQMVNAVGPLASSLRVALTDVVLGRAGIRFFRRRGKSRKSSLSSRLLGDGALRRLNINNPGGICQAFGFQIKHNYLVSLSR
jgi:hypothetical protein